MSTPSTLGSLRVSLRELLGLRLDDFASRLDVIEEMLEAREADDTVTRAIANISIEDMAPELADEDLQASLFFFRGAVAHITIADFPVLSKHLAQARLMATQHPERLIMRSRYYQEPVPGPRPRDAAMQGYRLARLVRQRIGLPTQPIDLIVPVVATPLGVHVAYDSFTDSKLGAMAARVEGGALIVLAGPAPSRAREAARAKVLIAHEICHVLFDDDGGATLAMFTDASVDDEARAQRRDLHEARARGFSAELLLPRDGLRELFGAPYSVSFDAGRSLVMAACRHFGTPWSLTTNHLKNLGYITEEMRKALELSPPSASDTQLLLPSAGDLLLPTQSLIKDPVELAYAARAQAADAIEQLRVEDERAVQHVVVELDRIASAPVSNEDDGLFLTETIDRLLREGQVPRLKLLVNRLPLDRVDPREITGALMVTRAAREALGEARMSLCIRALDALVRHHHWTSEEALAAIERLR